MGNSLGQAYQEYLKNHSPDKLLLDLDDFQEIYNLRNEEIKALENSFTTELDNATRQIASLIAINTRLLATNKELLNALGMERT